MIAGRIPFNPATQLAFDLPQAAQVELSVFDLLGRRIAVLAQGEYAAGTHTLRLDASAWASGTYFAVLQTEGDGRECAPAFDEVVGICNTKLLEATDGPVPCRVPVRFLAITSCETVHYHSAHSTNR